MQPLQTFLLPAPVELPCPAGESGPLCDRTASVVDVARRFGADSGAIAAWLQLLCGGSVLHPKAGPTQSCARPVAPPMRIRAVAGHMHMLGRSISIDLLRRDGTSARLLDVPVWNFDDQRATVLPHPVTVRPGDRLRVTCTHDASLREQAAGAAQAAAALRRVGRGLVRRDVPGHRQLHRLGRTDEDGGAADLGTVADVPSARLLAVQLDPTDPPARLGEWLTEAGLELDLRALDAGDELPADLARHAGCS